MIQDYKTIKKNELRSIHDEFSFASEMQTAVRSELWRNKIPLWTVLSGAADDAAKQCYIKINNMVSDIADVDTCNIHSLKSLAKSVDAEFLTKDLREDYDDDILELINLFSVPKEYLLNSNTILHESVNDHSFGYLTLKSLSIPEEKVPIDLIYNIKLNIKHIKHVFERNLLPPSKTLEFFIKSDLKDLKVENLKNSETILTFLESLDQTSSESLHLSIQHLIKSLTLEKILNLIDQYDKNEDLKIYTDQKLIVIDNNHNSKINYFYLLINIIKQNYYNVDTGIYLDPTYFNKEKNQTFDLSKLFFNIVGSIFNEDKLYLDEYVGYHFFYTILSKISNDKLKSNYIFDKKLGKYIINSTKQNEMTKDEFIAELTSFISFEEAIEFIKTNLIVKYRNEFIDFVECVSKLNKILKYKNKSEEILIDYNVLKVNFPHAFPNNNYNEILYGNDGLLYYLTKSYIDECIKIRKIREDLKNLIQQYTFIGTKRIATDLLYNFFLKNYSKNESIGYFSSDELIKENETTYDFAKVKRSVEDLIHGSGLSDDKFEVNIIEYYDQTNYLNIDSSLPTSMVENSIIGYEEIPSTYLDQNYLITSSYVKAPIYSTSYAPCSLFIKDYNEKFWNKKTITLNSELSLAQFNNDDYVNFYSSYIPEIKVISLNTFRNDYVNNNLIPLLNNIWDTFALSSVLEEDLNTDSGRLYKEYIGNSIGKNKYINNANTVFPTIAPINSIENLIECKNYDDDRLLFLAKNYYSNVISKIKIATKKILNMYNNDGIPHEGWKQSYLTFHGYSTYYESSNNKLQYSIKTSKNYKNNGPFVYSKLQDYIYEHYLSGMIDIKEFLKEYDLPSSISGLYNYYLNGDGNKIYFKNNLNNNEIISDYRIEQYDEDIYENCFTLFKKRKKLLNEADVGFELTGKLYFRSYTMPLSIPLMEDEKTIISNQNYNYDDINYYDVLSVSNQEIRNDLRKTLNHCIEFGILNKHMWIFGKCDNLYKLVSFKYDFKNGYIFPDITSLNFYNVEESQDSLKSLNDFVGAFYDDNTIHLITFDCYSLLKDLSNKHKTINSNIFLNESSLKFTEIKIDTKTSNIIYKPLEDYNVSVSIPMFLNHNNNDEIDFKNDERIWKILFKDNKCFITYKSISKNIQDETFFYYFTYNSKIYKIQSMNINWNSDFEYIDLKEETLLNEMNFELNQNYDSIILSNEKMDDYDKIITFKNQLSKITKCYFKNARIYSNFNPFNIGYKFTDNFVDHLISGIISGIVEFDDNIITFEGFKNLLRSDYVTDWINGNANKHILKHKWTYKENVSYNNLINSYDLILSSIINEMNDNELKLSKKWEGENIVSSIYNETNKFYREIPIINECVINPLKVDIVFQNDSGVTFLNRNTFDLDLTCYIDDEIEKNRKVGYGNVYKQTGFMTWEGDVTDGRKETVVIDVNKYIREKFINKNINTMMKIVFNICWHQNSEITTSNVYALVHWNNLLEKYPIKVCGTNLLSCNTKSFELNIDMNTKELFFIESKLYPVISINYKEKLKGYDAEPDIKFGIINLTENDFSKLNENEWIKYSDKLYYKKENNNILYLLNDNAYIVEKNNDSTLLNLYKRLISNLFYINKEKEKIEAKEFILDQIYFGIEYGNNNEEVDFNYIIYLNPGKFTSIKKLKYKINAILHDNLKMLSYELTEKENTDVIHS